MVRQNFIAYLLMQFPDLAKEGLEERISEHLLSPYEVKIDHKLLEKIKYSVQAIAELRGNPRYKQNFPQFSPAQLERENAMMMSLDFHVEASGGLKLIEVNTNASFLMLGLCLYHSRNLKTQTDFDFLKLEQMFAHQANLKDSDKRSVIITDAAPSSQRLYIEFLVYREFLRSRGWKAEIADVREIDSLLPASLIYNRSTDFLLDSKDSEQLKEFWLNKNGALSPNPCDYTLLADKARMEDWTTEDYLDNLNLSVESRSILKDILPRTRVVTSENREEIWSQRKKLFFKPTQAFGSKQAFKGASISRKAFDELSKESMLAQDYIQPDELEFPTQQGPQNFKYDLRCFFYGKDLQLVVARLFQGQVTNLRTPGGGFAPVVLE